MKAAVKNTGCETLPSDWKTTKVGDIAEIKLGKMLDRGKHTSGTSLPYLRNINVRWGEFDTSDLREMFFDADEVDRYSVRLGDLVVCEGGEPGRAAIWKEPRPALFQKALHRVRPGPAVTANWLLVCLRHYASNGELMRFVSGTTIKHFTREAFLRLPVPLPPIPEQRRIVARLEALTTQSRRARALLADVPKQLAQARQSLLASAFRGDLTADWRSRSHLAQSGHELLAILNSLHEAFPSKKGNAAQATEGVHELDSTILPSTWAIADLRTLCRPDRPICYGILMPGPELKEGVPYVRVADFPKDRISLETVRSTSTEIDAKFARSRLSAGDILLSIRGTVGRLAVVPPELEGANITQDTARLSIHPSVSSEFVLFMLRSPDTFLRMQLAVKGVAVRGINIGDVRPLQIPLPPLPEQHEIVRRLSAAFARLDAAAAAHAASVGELDRLDQSLLARAFSGAL